MAVKTTTVEARLEEQFRVAVEARQHKIILDEPKDFGSSDEGMTPIEALLGALGACKCIVARYYAKEHGVELEDISVKLEGELDSDGFLGINKSAKIGLSSVRSIYQIKSPSPKEKIEALVTFVDKTCPVADSMINAPTLNSVIHVEE